MVEPKDSHQNIGDVVDIGVSALVVDANMRSPSLCSEPERIFYRKRGKVDVIFGAILKVSSIVFGDLIR